MLRKKNAWGLAAPACFLMSFTFGFADVNTPQPVPTEPPAPPSGLQCTKLIGPRPGLQCINRNSESGTIVTTRHLPAWGVNAGLVVVDMCRVPIEMLPTGAVFQPLVRPLTEQERELSSEPLPDSCIRRFCTDKIKEFSIMLNVAPIPIGGSVVLGLEFGFKSSSFQVLCETFAGAGEEI
jgi:hypothetical protein